MASGARRKILKAAKKVQAEISAFALQGRVAGGLASEGYTGGYLDALRDVQLVLDGVRPKRYGWWEDER